MQNICSILDCMYLKKHGSFEHNATFNPIQDIRLLLLIVVVGVINKCMVRLDFTILEFFQLQFSNFSQFRSDFELPAYHLPSVWKHPFLCCDYTNCH